MPLSRLPQWAATFRLSLRELFVLVAFVALAIVSLKYASPLWMSSIAALAMVASLAGLIVAAVDSGRRQAFAIGFSLASIGYAAILIFGLQKDVEYNFASGRLPTTLLLRRAYVAMREPRWFDPNTRQVISESEAQTQRRALGSNRLLQNSSGPTLANVPSESYFMAIGHCWWAVLLGYVGGRFARHVYRRRESDAE